MKKSLENALQQLTQQIRDIEDTHDYSSLRKTVGQIYEEVMLEEFLHARKAELSAIVARVENRVSGEASATPESSAPKVVSEGPAAPPAPAPLDPVVKEDPSTGFLSDEIKVVPIPNGPPKPVHTEDKVLNTIAEEPVKAAPVKPAPVKEVPEVAAQEKIEPTKSAPSVEKETAQTVNSAPRKASVNDRANRGPLKLGLNDKIAFVKHLFNGSQEDLQRVLNQLNTMSSLEEVHEFLGAVKGDYNQWEGKEEYEERLVEMLSARFVE